MLVTKLIMAGNLFWNGGIDLLIVYHGKAMALIKAVSGSLLGIGHNNNYKFHSHSPDW